MSIVIPDLSCSTGGATRNCQEYKRSRLGRTRQDGTSMPAGARLDIFLSKPVTSRDAQALMAPNEMKMLEKAAAVDVPSRRARVRQAPRQSVRWVREVKGIVALAVAAFGLTALGAFDPSLS